MAITLWGMEFCQSGLVDGSTYHHLLAVLALLRKRVESLIAKAFLIYDDSDWNNQEAERLRRSSSISSSSSEMPTTVKNKEERRQKKL